MTGRYSVGSQLLRDGDFPAALELAVKSASPRSWAPTNIAASFPNKSDFTKVALLWERNFCAIGTFRQSTLPHRLQQPKRYATRCFC